MTILFIALLGLLLIGLWNVEQTRPTKHMDIVKKPKVTASNKPTKLSKATGSK